MSAVVNERGGRGILQEEDSIHAHAHTRTRAHTHTHTRMYTLLIIRSIDDDGTAVHVDYATDEMILCYGRVARVHADNRSGGIMTDTRDINIIT